MRFTTTTKFFFRHGLFRCTALTLRSQACTLCSLRSSELHIGGQRGSRPLSAKDKDLPRVEFSYNNYLNPVLVVTDRRGKLRMCDRLYDHWRMTQCKSISWPLRTEYHEFPKQPAHPHEDDSDDDWRRAGGPTKVDVCVEDGTRVVLCHRGEFEEVVQEGPISIATWKALFDDKTYDEIWAKLQHNRRLLYHEAVAIAGPDFGAFERIWGSSPDRSDMESMLRLQYPRAFCDDNGELWTFSVSSDPIHFQWYDPVFERH